MHHISHYEVTNRQTGKVTRYQSGTRASRAADRMDQAYGAIICTRRAVWVQDMPDTAATEALVSSLEERGFRCTPADIAAEHDADLSHLDAQGFVAASRQVTP